jgi:hypothetical protein
MILDQKQFPAALAKTTSSIQLLDIDCKKVRDVSHAEAFACVATGNYRAVGRASRVRYIQPLSKEIVLSLPPLATLDTGDANFWVGRHLWTWSARDFGKRPLALDGLPA